MSVDILQRCFTLIITALGYDYKQYSLHSLRRGGASVAHQAGVPATEIQRHGTWKSGAFWEYIVTNDIYNSCVTEGFSKLCI